METTLPASATHNPPAAPRKRHLQDQNSLQSPKKAKTKQKATTSGDADDVLLKDVQDLLARKSLAEKPAEHLFKPENPTKDEGLVKAGESEAIVKTRESTRAENRRNIEVSEVLPDLFSELDLTVDQLSSTGDGLAYSSDSHHCFVVPFTTPGDIVRAKVFRHFKQHSYSLTDFLHVIKPSPIRDDSLVRCKYFQMCSGCQLQMMPYEDQLSHKKMIIEKAYRNFSGLPPGLIPPVQETIGSPLQYGYRTKLTPHFDGPPGSRSRKDRRTGAPRKGFEEMPPIGFNQKGTRKVLDIEECPIATQVVQMGLARERQRVAENLGNYKKGATILLRESTERFYRARGADSSDYARDGDEILEEIQGDLPKDTPLIEEAFRDAEHEGYSKKWCITDNNADAVEHVGWHTTGASSDASKHTGTYKFVSTAGSFFQNNNSILPLFTQYIRDHISSVQWNWEASDVKYLIDAYSGSGLFTITLSGNFKSSTGIDISSASIESALKNAKLNRLDPERVKFIAADAIALFESVDYPPDQTAVVLDPPRKGCDESFLKQLLKFGPKRIVYVSCNVHTQARDVGVLVGGSQEGIAYEIKSLQGFDFFPQTGHVEGVAILEKKGPKAAEVT
ncbi:MAG: tRNA(m5U54)methyltransferase [Vezdaea acicularis]|nr:MAG: tRNA(m5U54)methyltransferase [Vezdaea acicularis]